jgi:hypothetical protein
MAEAMVATAAALVPARVASADMYGIEASVRVHSFKTGSQTKKKNEFD